MANIHSTAIIDGDVVLADDVEIGPGCVLNGPITIGAGTRLLGHVWLQGPLKIGERNTLYPGCRLGFAPQSLGYDASKPGHGLVLGDDNIMREGMSAHRAMTDDGPTRIGSNNFFMVNSHVGHDTQMGNHCTITNGALIAGHVIMGDRVTMGGNAGVHQFIRVGDGVMMSGCVGSTKDIPPWFTVTATNVCGGLNIIGMRRNGFTPEETDDARWTYRKLYRSGRAPKRALELLREREDRPVVARYIEFVETSERGITPGHGRARRGVVNA